jgi:hypothetical protein
LGLLLRISLRNSHTSSFFECSLKLITDTPFSA